MSTEDPHWPERRFSQAISEGDGISVIPILRGDLPALALAAEEAGAEAIAVDSVRDVSALREVTDLPLLVREVVADVSMLQALRGAGADACVLVFEDLADEGELLEDVVVAAGELGLDCALDVRDEEQLEEALERVDPEILVISERDPDKDETDLERTLELLPDVPAGKLVVSESRVRTREQVLELERAGVDAVLLSEELDGPLPSGLAELTGRRST
jgi:indole-3-glycerol phosphate synthase